MTKVNHINLPDYKGEVYCKKLNQVVELDEKHISRHCNLCKMYAGSAQGRGVECQWEDNDPNIPNPYTVSNSKAEADRVYINKLKDNK
ncbi:hypothetical protein [Bacillus phage YungSlug]|nr:hypothetical protein [Bacillus phage YungSlug]